MRRSGWSCVLGGVALGAILLSSTPTVACSLAGYPAFGDVRDDARTIFAGRVTAARDVDGQPDQMTIDVTEVFKGRVPADPLTRGFVVSACNDDLPYLAGVGDRVVIAMGYDGYGRPLDPAWVFRDDGRVRSSTVAGGGRTYDELAAALRGGLPPTDGLGGSSSDLTPVLLALAGAVGACAWWSLRRAAPAP